MKLRPIAKFAILGTTGLSALAAWALLTEGEFRGFFGIVLLMSVNQMVLLIPAATTAIAAWVSGIVLRSFRVVLMCWCVLSAIVVSLATTSRYLHHGFLGWARDNYWELESTVGFGVTVGELTLVVLVVLTQVMSVTVLIADRTHSLPNPRLQPTSGTRIEAE